MRLQSRLLLRLSELVRQVKSHCDKALSHLEGLPAKYKTDPCEWVDWDKQEAKFLMDAMLSSHTTVQSPNRVFDTNSFLVQNFREVDCFHRLALTREQTLQVHEATRII